MHFYVKELKVLHLHHLLLLKRFELQLLQVELVV